MNTYIDAFALDRNFLTGQSADIFRCISGREVHPSIVVIIVDSYDHAHTVQITGKSKLAVSKLQFCITSVAQSRGILSDLSKSGNQSCTWICFFRICVVCKNQGRSQAVIRGTFLASFNSKLRTIIDTWNSRKSIKKYMNRIKMRFIGQFGVDSFYIVIVNKVVQIKISHVLEIFHCMCDLEIVMVIVSTVKSFVQSIVCDTVQCLAIYPAAVIAMDNFTHQPEIRFDFLGSTAECTHEIKIQDISGIQTDSIDIKLRNPVANHITDIILDFRISLVQLDKQIVSAPVVIGKSVIVFIVSPEIDIAVPVKVLRMFAVLLDILECKEITSCVVEYTVEDYFDAFFVTCFDKSGQVFVCSKTGVKLLIIGGFITMSDTFEERSDVQGGASDLFDVVDPWEESVQTVDRSGVLILFRCTAKSKWIDVIKNCFIVPTHRLSSRFVVIFLSPECCMKQNMPGKK